MTNLNRQARKLVIECEWTSLKANDKTKPVEQYIAVSL